MEEREERGPYIGAGDLVRRTGLRPQAVESLVMAGAFDRITPNRRQSLWDAGLYASPKRNGQADAAALDGGLDTEPRRLLGGREDGGRVPRRWASTPGDTSCSSSGRACPPR